MRRCVYCACAAGLTLVSQGWWVVIGDTATDSLLAIKVRVCCPSSCRAAAHLAAALFLWKKPQGFPRFLAD